MPQQYLFRVNMERVVLGIHICVPHASKSFMCQKKGVTYYYNKQHLYHLILLLHPPLLLLLSLMRYAKNREIRYCFMFGILLLCEIPIWFLTFHPLSLLHLLILLTIISSFMHDFMIYSINKTAEETLSTLWWRRMLTLLLITTQLA